MATSKAALVALLAGALLSSAAGCGGQAEPTATPPGGPGDSEELTSVECYSGFLVQTSFEELERDATTIVIGTGTGESRPMQEPDYFGVVYQVEVERYLKGAGPDMLPIYQTEGCVVTVRGKQFRGPIGDALSPIREGARYLFFLRPHPYQPEETLHVLYGPVLRAILRPSRFVLDGGRASPDSSWLGASKYFPAMPESDLIDTVEEIVLAASMASARAGGVSERVYRNLAETGADFAPDFGEARDATFTPTLTKDSAVEIAIDEFMRGFDLPAGRGIESRIDARAVTAIFSGSSDSFSRTWDVVEREVWVVALWDLPIRIPCGGPVAAGCPDSVDPPHFTLAVDARTGEIVGGEISGAGGVSSTWDGVDLRPASVEPPVTPTPFPTATTVASSMDNPKRILPAITPTTAATPPGPMATPEPTSTPATLEREQRTATPTPARKRVFSWVGSFFPSDGATGVPTGTVIRFQISRPQSVMLLHLEPAATLNFIGDETPDEPSQIRVYKPQTDLASGTTYTATVEWGYTDPGPDNENRRTTSWSFTTAP